MNETINRELNGRLLQGVGVMKDTELKLEESETSVSFPMGL